MVNLKSLILIVIFTLIVNKSHQKTMISPIDAFRAGGIIDDLNLPSTGLDNLQPISIEYANGKKVNFGTELTPTEASSKPTVFNFQGDPSTNYTVLMVDPDATSRTNPVYRSILHWMIINVPGSGNSSQGEIAANYRGPRPPPNSGLHRYIFLVYKQTAPLPFVDWSDNIRNFNTTKWVTDNGLSGPLFSNYFVAQNESTRNQA